MEEIKCVVHKSEVGGTASARRERVVNRRKKTLVARKEIQ